MEATKYHFSAELNAGQFKPEGYIERQKTKTIILFERGSLA